MSETHPFIERALALAAKALYLSSPNPRVGCVIASPGDQVLGEGFTQQAGGPHAEIEALRAAQAAGHDVRGATAYVTLEPCAHQGRTGPCCDALVAAGIARVVASIEDPNPLVAGQGFARLRAAGVEVQVGPGAAAARELNLGFFSRMQRGIPWVRMKVAASLDGTTALANGTSQWITSPASRADGHAWRARACALLTGIGTVLADNPRLDVREVATVRQPQLFVLDSRLQTPPGAHIFIANRTTTICGSSDFSSKNDALAGALAARGASVLHLPASGGHVDLHALVRALAERGVNELHVEAGARLNGALLQAGLVDELLLYLAPTLLGPGCGLAQRTPIESLTDRTPLSFHSVERIGPDLRVLARVGERDRF